MANAVELAHTTRSNITRSNRLPWGVIQKMATDGVTVNHEGKPAKRRNHTVPKALLKRWLIESGGKQGYWVLDCASGQISFHPGTEASFAISEFRYVPVRTPAGEAPHRDESVENWFSRGESDLALITDRLLENRTFQITGSAAGGFIQAAILLGFRSAYEYERIEQLVIASDPSIAADELSRQVVDHFSSIYSSKLGQFSNWDYQVVPSTSEPLLICDRPMFDMTTNSGDQELLIIPLAPSRMLVATPPSDRHRKSLQLTVSDKTSASIVALANEFTIERARQFVVGLPDQLTAIQPRFSASLLHKRMATDRFVILPNRY